MMDPKTQITPLHGISVLDMATRSYEDNLVLSLVREYPDDNCRALANVALNAYVNLHGTPMLAAAYAARQAGNSPNTSLCPAVAILGPVMVQETHDATQTLLELFRNSGMTEPADTELDLSAQLEAVVESGAIVRLLSAEPDRLGQAMLDGIRARNAYSVFTGFLTHVAARAGGHVTADAVLAAICCHLAWRPLVHKRLSVITLANMPWHIRIFGTVVGGSVRPERQTVKTFGGVAVTELLKDWSFTETAYLALLTRRPTPAERFAFTILLGLTASNGPGTISAQGAKGAVSADGPEAPERIRVNKAYAGFLSHTGYAHGGNGFEAMQFMIQRFGDLELADPGDPEHGLDLVRIAADYALIVGGVTIVDVLAATEPDTASSAAAATSYGGPLRDGLIALVSFVCLVAFYTSARFRPPANPAQSLIMRIILGLCAAGVAAVIPGILDLEGSPVKGFSLRATGAISMFVIVL